jgi:hypothetical protein
MAPSLFGSIKNKLTGKSAEAALGAQNSSIEAPPPYTPAAPTASSSQAQARSSHPVQDDQFEFLRSFDTIFVIDDSSSMRLENRWREAAEALEHIAPICTLYDEDGVDVYFLNAKSGADAPEGKAPDGYYNITTARQVSDLFARTRPTAATPTGARLRSILKPYTKALKQAEDVDDVRPINIIVITDGAASDVPEDIIVTHAKELDDLGATPYQVGIQFFQVGRDPGAAAALAHLDDGLEAKKVRDMVDTVAWNDEKLHGQASLSGDSILKIVLGAVNKRLDRQSSKVAKPGLKGMFRSKG